MSRNFYRFIIKTDKIYKRAIEHNMAIMQSEYLIINAPQFVENNLNTIKEVKENDIILLEKNGKIYDWGYAIKPRKYKHKSDKIEYLNFNDMIDNIYNTDGVKYISGKYKGIIYFNDCECFYNNLTEVIEKSKLGVYCWGQRIDIDKWRHHSEDTGLLPKNFDLEENPSDNIYKIKKEIALRIIEELTGDIISENNKFLLGDYIELLMNNRNLILTGAPGTGKTYLAKQIANEIGKYKFVQFHPSYDYTDFVEGLRPIQNEKGDIIFERKDGVFKEFCKEALNNKSSNFVFIIDEINRGEISKIFGELFFSVDAGYRGEKGKVLTQYANLIEDGDEFKDGFYIPENVYIIGTMNDIDRSVESMDFAMRRRFAWKEIKAKDTQNMLDEYKWENKIDADIIQNAKEKMNKLNDAISNTPELSDAYNIGASYFLKLDNYYNGDENKAFEDLWKNHLEGLLFEYTRGMSNQKEIIDNLEKAYNLQDNNSINDNSIED